MRPRSLPLLASVLAVALGLGLPAIGGSQQLTPVEPTPQVTLSKNNQTAAANSTAARLSYSEKSRETAKGAEVITYTFRAEGLPKDKRYALVGQWMDGRRAEAGKGLQIDDSGRVLGSNGEEVTVKFASMFPGEFVVIGLVSEDKTAQATVEVTPFPNQAEGKGGCRLAVQPMMANGQVFRISGEGFIPNHDIRISGTSSGEHSSQTVKGKADGTLNFSIFPAVVGKTGGDASFTASDSSCSATVNYKWGDQMRGSTLTAEQRAAIAKEATIVDHSPAEPQSTAPGAPGEKGGWSALSAQGMALAQQNKLADAEAVLVRALAMAEKDPGRNDSNVAQVADELASVYTSDRKFKEAEPLFKRALSIVEKSEGPDSANASSILYSYAMWYAMQDKYTDAEPLFRRSLEIAEKALGPDNPRVAQILTMYAELMKETHRPDEAKQMEARAKKILQKSSAQ